MTISIIQSATNALEGSHTSNTATLATPPTAGNTLVLDIVVTSTTVERTVDVPSGWTERQREWTIDSGAVHLICTKVAGVGASSSVTVTFTACTGSVMDLYETDGAYLGGATVGHVGAVATGATIPSITPAAGIEALLMASNGARLAYGVTVGPSGYTVVDDAEVHTFDSMRLSVWRKYVATTTGSYSASITYGSGVASTGAHVWFGIGAVVADFTHTGVNAVVGQVVAFTDTSGGSPTSWLWDFGDGDTSTSQNPTHAYTSPGTYNVTLTATGASGSDDVTKVLTILTVDAPEPPPPAGVLLEIYAAEPGAAKWDVAKWDEAVWSGAGWQDVTPYGIHVNITWGSNKPEMGILTVPDAASWAVDYHDPDRILDPSNADGPYYGDLRPYLPIRVSHRGTIVRVGYVTGISHNFKYPSAGYGYMRGADNITRLANAEVPPDTELADTLYARAVDAIAAAGLSVSVAVPIGTDPPVSPWLTGTRSWSVWEWIKDAAQEVLHVPYIDRLGTLCFRPWASPLVRARSLASPELVDMAVVTDYSGLYSVVQAREDEDTVIERALTPPPRYGARTFTRDEITIDPGAWAEAVLADRALHNLLWKPGSVRPLTATSAEQLATIEMVERIGITLIEQSPPVIAAGIVVGGEIDVVGKKDDEAIWRFVFETAQTATEPLIETGGEPTDYLLASGGGEYLYPTGGA